MAWVRLWLHPIILWELVILHGRSLRLVGNYWLNRAHGIPVDEVNPEMLDPGHPMRDVRRRFERGRRSFDSAPANDGTSPLPQIPQHQRGEVVPHGPHLLPSPGCDLLPRRRCEPDRNVVTEPPVLGASDGLLCVLLLPLILRAAELPDDQC